MTGRRISKASHRMSGEVFVVRAVPSSVRITDNRLSRATDRDSRAIVDAKQELAPDANRQNGAH